jgi:cytochrome d ubiquinol oxidase subunit I
MSSLDLARWQFGITTVYHFIFVPLTIGLAPMVAIMQTVWHRTGNPVWLRLTRFFGKLLLINFALGVVTGIVQEFQFGMNWSSYSRFVGDVFGAPLAMEGLAAFFLESTFLGLWIFGWDRLPKRVHLATIWLLAVGVNLSAYFILAANSFMQHPVGVRFNPESGRAELDSIMTMLTNVTALATFPHVIAGAWLVAGGFVLAVSAWHLARRADKPGTVETFRPAFRFALGSVLVAGVAVVVSGHWQGQIMVDQQPMKMAAAEALCNTEEGAGLSLFAVGSINASCDEVKSITIPGLLSFMSENDPDATVQGVNDVQKAMVERYGAGDYVPNLPVTYWSFRLMIGLGLLTVGLALVGLWLTRRGRVPGKGWYSKLAVLLVVAPFAANSFGWIFTEMGRQPWVVVPNPDGLDAVRMLTADGVSPSVGATSVAISLITFTLVYAALAAVEFTLLIRYAKAGPLPDQPVVAADDSDRTDDSTDERPMAFAY